MQIIKQQPPKSKKKAKRQPPPTFVVKPITRSNSFVGTEEYIAPVCLIFTYSQITELDCLLSIKQRQWFAYKCSSYAFFSRKLLLVQVTAVPSIGGHLVRNITHRFSLEDYYQICSSDLMVQIYRYIVVRDALRTHTFPGKEQECNILQHNEQRVNISHQYSSKSLPTVNFYANILTQIRTSLKLIIISGQSFG